MCSNDIKNTGENHCDYLNNSNPIYQIYSDDIEEIKYETDGKTVKSISLKQGSIIKIMN